MRIIKNKTSEIVSAINYLEVSLPTLAVLNEKGQIYSYRIGNRIFYNPMNWKIR